MKDLRKCICCGKEYEYCPKCGKYDKYPRWMINFHDANCNEIFKTAIEYVAHNITDDQARARLDKCDLSNKTAFQPAVQVMINELYPPVDMPKPETATDAVEDTKDARPLVHKKIKIKGGAERTVKE